MLVDVDHLPRVIESTAAQTRTESRANIPQTAQRLAVLAAWSPTSAQSRSISTLVQALQRNGYWVVVVTTCPDPQPLQFHPDVPLAEADLTVVRRPNIGYDFGSWAVGLHYLQSHLRADKILLVNDSLVGPFAPISDIIAHFEATSADVWGLVESNQFYPHLQSFFRGFRYGALAEFPLQQFWNDVRVIDDKDMLIRAYEYGFTLVLRDERYSSTSYVHHRDVVWDGLNPTINGWRNLLRAGVPFVKRELVRNPSLCLDGADLPREVEDLYGVDLSEWL